MEKTKWNWNNISQYKINKFTTAWTTMYILNIITKYLNKFEPRDRQFVRGYINQYYNYYRDIFYNDPELCKILKRETGQALKEDLEEIYKAGVQ